MLDRRFRELAMVFYLRLRRGGLSREGAREMLGALVNSAHAIDLFDIQSHIRIRDFGLEAMALVAQALTDPDDTARARARRAMPHLLAAQDGFERQLQEHASRLMASPAI